MAANENSIREKASERTENKTFEKNGRKITPNEFTLNVNFVTQAQIAAKQIKGKTSEKQIYEKQPF